MSMNFSLLMGPQPGDIYFWNNPLSKNDDKDLSTHQLCGDRPALILTITNYTIQFAPCTRSIKKYGQIFLKSKNPLDDDYRITHPVLIDSSDDRFIRYIGHVNIRCLELIRSILASAISNPYVKTAEIDYVLSRTPISKVIKLGNDLVAVVNGNNSYFEGFTITEIPKEQDNPTEYYLNDFRTGKKYLCNFRTFNYYRIKDSFTIIGSFSESTRSVFNWKIQERLMLDNNRLLQKIKTLEKVMDENNVPYPSTYVRETPIPLAKSILIDTSKTKGPQRLIMDEPVKPAEIRYMFEDYFKPPQKSTTLKAISSFDDLKSFVSQIDTRYGKWFSYYYRRLIRDSIDSEKAPWEVKEFQRTLVREYTKKKS